MAINLDQFAATALTEANTASAVGNKAANLAKALKAGLPVVPGFVLTWQDNPTDSATKAWRALSQNGAIPLVVRSTSIHEDQDKSSMAGQFVSVLDVMGWDDFTAAVAKVRNSAPADHQMAILVQPMLKAVAGGIVFTSDPLTEGQKRILVSAVRGGPHQLVDGTTSGTRYQLRRHFGFLSPAPDGPAIFDRRQLYSLTHLAKRVEKTFKTPQDIEFGFDQNHKIWLFQTRPITAMAPRPPKGSRLLGPGPVAETFPRVLQPLEEDLWMTPMSHGLTLALDIVRAFPRKLLRALPVVQTVNGRAAADLMLLGAVPHPHPILNFINPSPGLRRASAAWRVGRLQATLPYLATDLLAETDRQLTAFAVPAEMLYGQLLSALGWGRTVLSALHAQESLAGALLGSGRTVASEALSVLAEGRERGLKDAELIGHHPVLLALLAPSLAGWHSQTLPAQVGWTSASRGVWTLPPREGLRLRIRWVQEMQASMAREIGQRLHARGDLDDPRHISRLRWAELQSLAEGDAMPDGFSSRLDRVERAPLPSAFYVIDGAPIAVAQPAATLETEGTGAGGGFGIGVIWDATDSSTPRPAHPVLVVRTLDPALASLLPSLAGLVAETGSVLSHLAILAREYQVPTVVGVANALERFPAGTPVSVDGVTGTVQTREEAS
ncbi:MAG: hypothetical protein HOQ05_06050 [Corynebacteriales bacterium]|nr:hypothetical protein [Mycobacteriales bacterium]